jgi:hypothetical protein
MLSGQVDWSQLLDLSRTGFSQCDLDSLLISSE